MLINVRADVVADINVRADVAADRDYQLGTVHMMWDKRFVQRLIVCQATFIK